MHKLFFIFVFSLSTLMANSLQNNQTIILTSNSTYDYAKACFDMLKSHFKNVPAFILKSDSGFYMVTTGMYSNKEAVYTAMKSLPQALQDEKPFRGTLKYDLTSKDSRILFAQNLPKQPITPVNTQKIEQMDKQIINDMLQEEKKVHPSQQEQITSSTPNTFVDSMSLSFGQNWKNNDVYRIGFQKNFQNKYFETATGYVSGYYDLSFNQIEYSSNVYAIGLTPIFAYYFNTQEDYKPYIYGGIGAAYISRTKVDEKEFSTSFQFEDQLGLGITTDDVNFQLGYVHYSNANIKKPNDGMDIGLFSIIFNF